MGCIASKGMVLENNEKSKTTARLTQSLIFKTIFQLAWPAKIFYVCMLPRQW